ncbi:MAG: PQQ-binding-like beta-propeller repeat protein [candidate division Zixibacteria bacterium]|nr:PQQ-binding-like beta-propeller repeat protein [candidate division Zixibacteria bacterium]
MRVSRDFAIAVAVLTLVNAPVIAPAAPPSKDGVIQLVRNAPPGNLRPTLLENTPLTTAQAGTPLALPGSFCIGDWMGPQMNRVTLSFAGGETYFSLQDPSGTLPYSWGAACTPAYTFNATAINIEVNKRPASEQPNPFTFNLQPVAFDADLTNPGCPIPGGVKCAGPVYQVTLNGGSTAGVNYLIKLPFVVECCVTGPYFAAVYLSGSWEPGIAQVLTDGAGSIPAPPPAQPCHNYLHDGAGLYDWVNDLMGPYHLRLYSEGYTPNDPATACAPGVCGWQWWYGVGRGVANPVTDPELFAYTLPSLSGARQKMATRFASLGLDTLKQIAFMGMPYTGAPDVLVEIFGAASGASCGLTTNPGALLYSVTVPYASLVNPPLTNNVPIPDVIWGNLNGGLSQDLFVALSVPNGPAHRYALYTRTRSYGSCTTDPHTMFNVSGSWLYGGEYSGNDDEAYIDAYICKERVVEIPSACTSAHADDWNTWMHDYQRTGASGMTVGNPCEVRAEWSKFLPKLSSFTSPVIAGGKVYVASDNEVNSFDLATGTPGNRVGVFPYTSGQVRCNVSVEGNRAFITGGTANSISCWDTTLSTVYWSNDLSGPGLAAAAHGSLLTRNRFGAAAVYRVGTDSIVVIGTEMTTSSNHGWLYALDARTGFLYSGWGTNPIALDRGSLMSPSFDGTNLYVGTATFGSLGDGSLYSINAATGAVNWNFKDAAATLEGWPGGVSVEGAILYGATYYNDAPSAASGGHRYAIDVSLAGPGPTLDPSAIRWRMAEGPTLYAAPTIGPNFLYIPQDDPSAGILMVDKFGGTAIHNFSVQGVAAVPINVTLSCDKYLFAGDRLGWWYLLNTTDQSLEWRRQFTGIVNGTAIAHNFANGEDYAVVSARSAVLEPSGYGVVTAWRFHQQLRPFLHQYVYSTEIQVPLGTPSGQTHTEAGVFSNDGCVSLNFQNPVLWDPPPSAGSYTDIQRRYAAAYVDRHLGSDYVTRFKDDRLSKRAILAGVGARGEDDLTAFDKAIETANKSRLKARATGSITAGTDDVLRTSAVSFSANPLPPGQSTNVSWMYDGTGLGRGTDEEYIEFPNNDPDLYPEDLTYSYMYPTLHVVYNGGCPEASTVLNWNTLGAPNSEKVFNHGSLGDGNIGALVWGADDGYSANLYDGSLVLSGEKFNSGRGQVAADFYNMEGLFRPELRRSDSTCGFDGGSSVHMGYRRQGGCPGIPVEILGEWVRSNYVDTTLPYGFTNVQPINTFVTQTEVGANDPMYGDFKLISWRIKNRDSLAKELRAGTYMDWDVANNPMTNVGLISDSFDGYAIWDALSPRFAYGMFDPSQPSSYCGIAPATNSPHKISVCNWWGYWWDLWFEADIAGLTWDNANLWSSREYCEGPQGVAGTPDDRMAFLTNKGFILPANGTYNEVQAMFAVPAISNDVATIEALGVEVAKRAARWAGYARGDVNDDGCVNLADACWLFSGNQIYPDTYCGDVNNDGAVNPVDLVYLLAYLSGSGPAPQGEWRFAF